MSLKTLERDILFELNRLTIFKRRLKWPDVLEWNTSEETVKKNLREGETAVFAELCWVAVKKAVMKPLLPEAGQLKMNRQRILEAWINMAAIIRSVDPGDSDMTLEEIEAAAHRVLLQAEVVKAECSK